MTLRVVTMLLAEIPWQKVRSVWGDSSSIPGAVVALLSADTGEAIDDAYWRLDNTVVVQGQLYEAAVHVVAPLMVALQLDLPPLVRRAVMDLLVESSGGESHQDEVEVGNVSLGARCRKVVGRVCGRGTGHCLTPTRE